MLSCLLAGLRVKTSILRVLGKSSSQANIWFSCPRKVCSSAKEFCYADMQRQELSLDG